MKNFAKDMGPEEANNAMKGMFKSVGNLFKNEIDTAKVTVGKSSDYIDSGQRRHRRRSGQDI